MAELHTCLPLLLESLDSTSAPLLCSTLKTLEALMRDAPDALVEHCGVLVTRLLELSKFPAMAVRRAALQALRAMTLLPTHKVRTGEAIKLSPNESCCQVS